MIRSGQQQMNEELGMMYKKLTDPEEIEKERMKEMEREFIHNLAEDAGVSYNNTDDD